MAWKSVATLNFASMFLTAVGTALVTVEQTRTIGAIILATAAAFAAFSAKLTELGYTYKKA